MKGAFWGSFDYIAIKLPAYSCTGQYGIVISVDSWLSRCPSVLWKRRQVPFLGLVVEQLRRASTEWGREAATVLEIVLRQSIPHDSPTDVNPKP